MLLKLNELLSLNKGNVKETFHGENIQQVDSVKYVAVSLDKKLLFNEHEEQIRRAAYWALKIVSVPTLRLISNVDSTPTRPALEVLPKIGSTGKKLFENHTGAA